jgi:hypothetical protein
LSGSDADATREYRHISALLAKDDSGLSEDEQLDLARRLTELAPAQPDSWWSVATQIDWMLRNLDGDGLREHPLFPELISAWDQAMALDKKDAAIPYNKARALYRAGLLDQAYEAFMLAGRTELAHPSTDIEWPAEWHFENAADVALESGRRTLALAAAQAAVDAGASDADAASMLARLLEEGDTRGPT